MNILMPIDAYGQRPLQNVLNILGPVPPTLYMTHGSLEGPYPCGVHPLEVQDLIHQCPAAAVDFRQRPAATVTSASAEKPRFPFTQRMNGLRHNILVRHN